MSIPAGELRHRFNIDQKIESPTGTGGTVITYVPVKPVWGRMYPISGREFLTAEQIQSKIVARGKVRAPSGIQPTMRLRFRGLSYNVEAVLPDPVSGLEYEQLQLSKIQGVDDAPVAEVVDGGSPDVEPSSTFDGGSP